MRRNLPPIKVIFRIVLIIVIVLVTASAISALTGVGPVADALLRPGDRLVRPSDVPACGWAWRAVPAAPAGTASNELHAAVALSPTDAWAAGLYGGEEYALTLIERWNGKEWREAVSPSVGNASNHLYSMTALSPTDIWAVGASHQGTDLWRTLSLHWDGKEWSIVPTPSPGALNSLNAVSVVSSDEVWAVGDMTLNTLTGSSQLLVTRWDGKGWQRVETGVEERNATLSAVAALSSNDIWAAGSYTDKLGTLTQPLFLHWNGRSWQEVKVEGGGAVWGISARSASDIWAVGNLGPATATFHWDGKLWRRVPTPNPGDGRGNNSLNAVAVVASNEAWAVGSYSRGGKGRPLALRWDGNKWAESPAPTPGEYLDVLSMVAPVPASGGEIWAVGSTIADNFGNNLPLIQKYSSPCK
ncbi:MAG: hypothetical protein IVW55_15830 [Chloroflexi bacterium]|nr:hypothetical protein [Chloroflexota bacterium]